MTNRLPIDPAQDDARAFFRLRIAFGSLGIFLPLLLASAGLIADGRVQPSISDFFHTTQRDLLVGGLCAIGVFLASHRGLKKYPGRWISPDLIAIIAGLAAIGVAFFPNESDTVATFSQYTLGLDLSPTFHYFSASMLYLMMSLTCFLVYAPDAQGWEKQFYRVSGAIIWTTGWMVMILSGIKNNHDTGLAHLIETHNLVYWDESIGVWAFCVAWLLKAYRDRKRGEVIARQRARIFHGRDPERSSERPSGHPTGGGSLLRWLSQRFGQTTSFARRNPAPLAPISQTDEVQPITRVTLERHRRIAPRRHNARQSSAPRRKAG